MSAMIQAISSLIQRCITRSGEAIKPKKCYWKITKKAKLEICKNQKTLYVENTLFVYNYIHKRLVYNCIHGI